MSSASTSGCPGDHGSTLNISITAAHQNRSESHHWSFEIPAAKVVPGLCNASLSGSGLALPAICICCGVGSTERHRQSSDHKHSPHKPIPQPKDARNPPMLK